MESLLEEIDELIQNKEFERANEKLDEQEENVLTLNLKYIVQKQHQANSPEGLDKSDSSKKLLLRASELDPDYLLTNINLGIHCLENKDYKTALGHLQRANNTLPGNSRILYNLGVCYQKISDSQAALFSFAQAIKSEEQYRKPYINAALEYYHQGKSERAEQLLSKCLNAFPYEPKLLQNIAALESTKKNSDKLLIEGNIDKINKMGSKTFSNDPVIRFNEAVFNAREERFPAALEIFKEVSKHPHTTLPLQFVSMLNEGLVKEKMNNFKDANETYLEMVKKFSPLGVDCTDIRVRITEIRSALNKLNAAFKPKIGGFKRPGPAAKAGSQTTLEAKESIKDEPGESLSKQEGAAKNAEGEPDKKEISEAKELEQKGFKPESPKKEKSEEQGSSSPKIVSENQEPHSHENTVTEAKEPVEKKPAEQSHPDAAKNPEEPGSSVSKGASNAQLVETNKAEGDEVKEKNYAESKPKSHIKTPKDIEKVGGIKPEEQKSSSPKFASEAQSPKEPAVNKDSGEKVAESKDPGQKSSKEIKNAEYQEKSSSSSKAELGVLGAKEPEKEAIYSKEHEAKEEEPIESKPKSPKEEIAEEQSSSSPKVTSKKFQTPKDPATENKETESKEVEGFNPKTESPKGEEQHEEPGSSPKPKKESSEPNSPVKVKKENKEPQVEEEAHTNLKESPKVDEHLLVKEKHQEQGSLNAKVEDSEAQSPEDYKTENKELEVKEDEHSDLKPKRLIENSKEDHPEEHGSSPKADDQEERSPEEKPGENVEPEETKNESPKDASKENDENPMVENPEENGSSPIAHKEDPEERSPKEKSTENVENKDLKPESPKDTENPKEEHPEEHGSSSSPKAENENEGSLNEQQEGNVEHEHPKPESPKDNENNKEENPEERGSSPTKPEDPEEISPKEKSAENVEKEDLKPESPNDAESSKEDAENPKEKYPEENGSSNADKENPEDKSSIGVLDENKDPEIKEKDPKPENPNEDVNPEERDSSSPKADSGPQPHEDPESKEEDPKPENPNEDENPEIQDSNSPKANSEAQPHEDSEAENKEPDTKEEDLKEPGSPKDAHDSAEENREEHGSSSPKATASEDESSEEEPEKEDPEIEKMADEEVNNLFGSAMAELFPKASFKVATPSDGKPEEKSESEGGIRYRPKSENLSQVSSTFLEEWSREECLSKLREDPSNHTAHYRLAFLSFQESNFDDAKMHLMRVYELKPDFKTEKITSGLGEIFLMEEDYENAFTFFKKCYKFTSSNERYAILLKLGKCLQRLEKYDVAIKTYRKAISERNKEFLPYYKLAKTYLMDSKLEAAMDNFVKCLSINPDHVKSLIRLGQLKYMQKDNQIGEAIAHYNHALSIAPDNFVALMSIAKAYEKTGEIKMALKMAERACLSPEANEFTKSYLGTLYKRIRADSKAIEIFKSILRNNKENANACLELGTIYGLQSQFLKAKKYLRQAIRLDKKCVIAYLRLGKILQQRTGEINEAIECYKSIIKIDPSNYKAYFQLGLAHLDLNNLQEGTKYLKECIKCNMQFIDAWITMGNVLFDMNKISNAQKYFEQALSFEAENAEAMLGKANCLYNLRKYDEAIELYERLVEKEKNAEVYLNLGNCFSCKNETEKAIEFYNKSIDLDPKNSDTYYNLGNAHCLKKNFESACNMFTNAISIDPDNLNARFNLANALLATDQRSEAVKELEYCCARTPENKDWILLLCFIYNDAKEFFKSKERLLQLQQFHPNDLEVQIRLVQLFLEMGAAESAREEWEKCKKLKSEEPEIIEQFEILGKHFKTA